MFRRTGPGATAYATSPRIATRTSPRAAATHRLRVMTRTLAPSGPARLSPYLPRNPNGYCPVHSTGVTLPVGLGDAAPAAAEPINQV
jgi:hypothetical protein